MGLNGQQRAELRELIGEAFDRRALQRALDAHDRNLEAIAANGTFPEQVAEVVQAANRQGWVPLLLDLIEQESSDREDLRARVAALRKAAPAAHPAKTPGSSARLLGPDSPVLHPRHGSFFGRAPLIRRIVERLGVCDGRIGYVYGAPGMGKTSVCKAAIREYLAADPTAAALFVDLHGTEGLAGLSAALADSLGEVGLENEADVRDQLTRTAQANDGALVLYLDNFESVASSGEAVEFARSLAALDGVSVLCSTRQSLAGVGGDGLRVDRLEEPAAVELFLACWRSDGRDRPIEDGPDLRAFLRDRLSLHPFSIVLTASRGYPSLDKVIDEWSRRGIKLAKSAAESLEISFCLSWRVLSERERWVLLLIALFPQGLDETSWDELTAGIDDAWERRERLFMLSLLEPTRAAAGVGLLAPIREFVLATTKGRSACAEAGPATDVAAAVERALGYYVKQARLGGAVRDSPETVAARLRLAGDFLNLAGVLECVGEGEASAHISAVSALGHGLANVYFFGPLAGHLVGAQMLRLNRAVGDQLGEANTRLRLGELALQQGCSEEAGRECGLALELFRAVGDQLGEANTRRSLGDLVLRLGRTEEAGREYGGALELYRAVGDQLGEANTRLRLGELALRQGRNEEAGWEFGAALELYRVVGDQLGEANTERGLGDLALAEGRFDEAGARYAKALDAFRALGDPEGIAEALIGQGRLFQALGDPTADAVFREALDWANRCGSVWVIEEATALLGDGGA